MRIGILFTAYNCDPYIDKELMHLTEINLLSGINFFIYPGSTKDDDFLKIVVNDSSII
jgi:hypothetical protein